MKIRLIPIILSVLCLVADPFPNLAAGEKKETNAELTNGGFENPGDGTPAFWEYAGPDNTLSADGGIFFEGRRSAQLSLKGPGRETARLQQAVNVEAGKRYDFGGMIKTQLEMGYAQLFVVFLNKQGNELATFALPKALQEQNWVFQSMWIKSPNRSDTAYVVCFVHGKGKAWFDDIHFTPKLLGGY